MRSFSYKKSVQALNLFAVWSGGELNKMKALKLIWLSDRLHLRKYGRPILLDYYVAMANGPVASATRDILEKNSFGAGDEALGYAAQFIEPSRYEYKTLNEPITKVLSRTDFDSLKTVFDTYGHLDKYALRDLTHNFPEWKRWEDGLKKNEYKSHPMDYNDFFNDVGNQALFNEDEIEVELAKKLFLRKE
jgi:uncharacterized phage-associated protein